MAWDMIIGHGGQRVGRSACLGEGAGANKITEV